MNITFPFQEKHDTSKTGWLPSMKNEVLSIIRDITDRKVTEINLQWNESLLRIIDELITPSIFSAVDN